MVIKVDSSHKAQGGDDFYFYPILNNKKLAALRATGFRDLVTVTGAVNFSVVEPNHIPLGKMFIKLRLN